MDPTQEPVRHEIVGTDGQTINTEALPWNPHPKFAGVALRHLVTGAGTGGRLSLHHVRVDPGCSIGDHAHAGQVEIHDVLAGTGSCTLEGAVISYAPGSMAIMPSDKVHRVDAGVQGLFLLATFSPPLV